MLTTDASEMLDRLLELDSLTDLQHTVLRKAWEGKTYPAIAEDLGYDAGYVRDVGSKLWRVLSDALSLEINKANFRSQIQRYFQVAATDEPVSLLASPAHNSVTPLTHAAESPRLFSVISVPFSLHDDPISFYGREQEQVELTDWIEHQQCRLLNVLGMGGIGKTTLTQQLVQTLQPRFERIIWRSLRNAPPVRELIADILGTLGHLDDEVRWEDNLDYSLTLLISYFRQYRCLLIFDNLETILRSHERTGDYREGCEEYELLFAHVAQLPHQSCLITTSREKPKAFFAHEERSKQVRSIMLKGLSTQAVQQIFASYGFFSTDSGDWDQIVSHYAGNPLALKLVSSTVRGLFDGDLTEFRKLVVQGMSVSDDVDDLLDQQFRRLSLHETELMYWIASQREALTYVQLLKLLLNPVAQAELPRTLERLKRRSLLEDGQGRFTLQPMIAEYAIGRLIQELCNEITTGALNYLNRLALVNTQSTDYIRSAQVRQIVQPLIHHLIEQFGTQQQLEQQIERLKDALRESPQRSGYAAGNLLNLLSWMGASLSDRDFSNLTIWHACLAGKQLHGLNLKGCTFADSVFSETFGSVLCVAMSPDGSMVAAGTTSNDIYIWKSPGANSVAVLRGHQGWVRAIAFSPDGQWLASASPDQTVRLWNITTGECRTILCTEPSTSWAVAFSLDSQFLISGGDDNTLRLWNVSTGRCQQVIDNAHQAGISSLSVTPDGMRLISTGKDHVIKIWSFPDLSPLSTLVGHSGNVWCSQVSPNGAILATGSDDCTVRLWSLETEECLAVLKGHTRCVWTVGFSPDGQYLVSGGHDYSMRLWDLSTQQCLRLIRGHTNFVWSIVFSHDGNFLISGGHDQTLRWWQFPEGRPVKTLQGYSNGIKALSASSTTNFVVSGGRDPQLRWWNSETGELIKTLTPHSGWICSLAISPNQRWLASASEDLSIQVCCTQTAQKLQTFVGHECWIWSVAFSPDAAVLASASEDKTVRLWCLQSGQCLGVLQEHTHSVRSISFSPDQRFLASGSLDGTVQIWHFETQQIVQTLQTGRVHAVTFSADGQYFAYGNETGLISLCDAGTREPIALLRGHTSRISSLCFSADSQFLLSGSDDQTAKLWQMSNQVCLQTLSGHQDAVTSVSFGADATTTITGSLDATIRVWSIKNGTVLQAMRVVRPYEGMNIADALGLTETRKAKLRNLGATIGRSLSSVD